MGLLRHNASRILSTWSSASKRARERIIHGSYAVCVGCGCDCHDYSPPGCAGAKLAKFITIRFHSSLEGVQLEVGLNVRWLLLVAGYVVNPAAHRFTVAQLVTPAIWGVIRSCLRRPVMVDSFGKHHIPYGDMD